MSGPLPIGFVIMSGYYFESKNRNLLSLSEKHDLPFIQDIIKLRAYKQDSV